MHTDHDHHGSVIQLCAALHALSERELDGATIALMQAQVAQIGASLSSLAGHHPAQ